jgi:hypothetical protein
MSLLDDSGPQPDGTRTARQWMTAMGQDANLIATYLRESMTPDRPRELVARDVALARKEAQRLLSDIRRFADEVHGLSKEDVDRVGPL